MNTFCPVCPCASCIRARRHAAYAQGNYTPAAELPRVRAHTYQSALAIAAPPARPPLLRERRTPAAALTVETGVAVPSLAGLAVGAASCVTLALWARVFGELPGLEALDIGLMGGSAVGMAAGAFMAWANWQATAGIEREWATSRAELPAESQAEEQDADPDATRLHRYEVITRRPGGGTRYQYADLPATPERLAKIARAVLDGAPFSERQWQATLGSVKAFRELRDELIERGWLTWKTPGSPQQGAVLTEDRERVFMEWAGRE